MRCHQVHKDQTDEVPMGLLLRVFVVGIALACVGLVVLGLAIGLGASETVTMVLSGAIALGIAVVVMRVLFGPARDPDYTEARNEIAHALREFHPRGVCACDACRERRYEQAAHRVGAALRRMVEAFTRPTPR
jgi:hypothetical protein